MLDRFLRYIQIDSETLYERDFAEVLMKELKELGFEVEMDDAGEKTGSNSGNVIAKKKGNKPGKTIMLTAHMDTVTPGKGIKPEIRDGVIYSDGTTILASDDKAGVAAIMETMERLKEENADHADIEIVFSIFEEGGLFGAKNMDVSKLESEYAFVFDSSGDPGQIIVQGPAQYKIDVEFKGKAAHAGVAPETGVSAIMIAAEAISNMKLLRIDEETTANIGSIEGGGPTNIVTDSVKIKAEARSLDNDKLQAQVDHMVKCVKDAQEKYGIEANIKTDLAYSAFKTEEDDEIVKIAKTAMKNAGLEAVLAKSGGGSDTNIYAGKGMKAVNFGVGMKNCHSVDEHIKVEHLYQSCELVYQIVKAALD
ncbi:MAG: M20/M25/M40 family metallo-hydrolase [Tissierellia bacterium]|nr:M20/M25/M40 family metallo-hydrolase [Tissierellia bacterium]